MIIKEILTHEKLASQNSNSTTCLPDFFDDMPCDPDYCIPDAYNQCNPDMDEAGGCDPYYDDDVDDDVDDDDDDD